LACGQTGRGLRMRRGPLRQSGTSSTSQTAATRRSYHVLARRAGVAQVRHPRGCHWNDLRRAAENQSVLIQQITQQIEEANPDRLAGIFLAASFSQPRSTPKRSDTDSAARRTASVTPSDTTSTSTLSLSGLRQAIAAPPQITSSTGSADMFSSSASKASSRRVRVRKSKALMRPLRESVNGFVLDERPLEPHSMLCTPRRASQHRDLGAGKTLAGDDVDVPPGFVLCHPTRHGVFVSFAYSANDRSDLRQVVASAGMPPVPPPVKGRPGRGHPPAAVWVLRPVAGEQPQSPPPFAGGLRGHDLRKLRGEHPPPRADRRHAADHDRFGFEHRPPNPHNT